MTPPPKWKHPYLIATDAITAELMALPADARPAELLLALARLRKEQDARFVEVIGFAVRARLKLAPPASGKARKAS